MRRILNLPASSLVHLSGYVGEGFAGNAAVFEAPSADGLVGFSDQQQPEAEFLPGNGHAESTGTRSDYRDVVVNY